MNPENILQLVQQGFRVAIGTGTTLAETLQTPQTGLDAWNQLTTNPTQLAQDLAEKGYRSIQKNNLHVACCDLWTFPTIRRPSLKPGHCHLKIITCKDDFYTKLSEKISKV